MLFIHPFSLLSTKHFITLYFPLPLQLKLQFSYLFLDVFFLCSRLHVYGVDFRNLIALEWFCSYVIANYDRLDAIVNNAAQTVRRPPAYYAHLVEGEKQLSYDPSHEFPNVHFDADDGSKNNRNSDNDTTSSSCSNNDNSNSSNSSRSNSSTASSSCNKCDAESVTHTKSMQSVLYHQRKYTTSLKAAVEGSTLTYDHNSVNQNSTQTLVKGHGMDDPEPLIKSREFDIDSDTHRHVMEHIPEDGQSQMTPAISSSEMTQIQLTKVILMTDTE